MGMFDTDVPDPPLHCPVCRSPIEEWQGKEGPVSCGGAGFRAGVGEGYPTACIGRTLGGGRGRPSDSKWAMTSSSTSHGSR
jgi:hypothetical protein